MDLSDPTILFSSMFIGAVGAGLFLYGRRRPEPKCIGVGLVMCIYPMFVSSVLLMWLIAAACIGAAYILPRAE